MVRDLKRGRCISTWILLLIMLPLQSTLRLLLLLLLRRRRRSWHDQGVNTLSSHLM
jgi:hypothetical protein